MHRPGEAIHRVHFFLSAPNWRKFFIYLGLLWILNIADVWQTLALKYSGTLAAESNLFINHILTKGPLYFVVFKVLAVALVTMVLVRGYFDKQGIRMGEILFSTEQVRAAIQFLLILAIIYYLFVVYLPLLIVVATYYSA